jgi:succinate dehydrogenase / fumarate reductase flavoprotein subunit
VLDIYRKFTGEDPSKVPMKIFPAVHYSMGGAWVDWPAADDPDRNTRFRQMTNIPGCFNIGESEFQYHGANRLGANSLVACIFAGLVAGVEVPNYLKSLEKNYDNISEVVFESALGKELAFKKDLLSRNGKENVHKLHDDMAKIMVHYVTVKRDNHDLQRALEELKKIRERYLHISLDDHGSLMNQTYTFAGQFRPMLELALVITKGALLRNESRGSHFKPEFPKRDDEHFLKHTIASYDASQDEPLISYLPVDTRHLQPVARDYAHARKVKPKLENIPSTISLPL